MGRAMNMRLLAMELKMLQDAEEYNNREPPIQCPSLERSTLLSDFNKRLMQKKKNQLETAVKQPIMLPTWVKSKSHCCTKPFSELKPIHFGQMKVPFVHEGYFLACRVLTEAIAIFATEVLVEDTKGQVHWINFYNFNSDLNDSCWLKPGTIVLIEEPSMSSNANTQTPFILVDSPSGAIFVHKTNRKMLELAGALDWYEPETLSAQELKELGNAEFVQHNNEDALCYYERALALNNELVPVLHLNMAAALLELKRYPEASEHAKKALDGGANKGKALYRLGCAAYGMHSWSEAIGHFESALKANPALNLTAEKIGKAKARLQESKTGKYDLKKLLKDEEGGQRFMDVADYIGPVKVVDILGKGKGLIMTEDVPKGTLLLAEKAYAFATEGAIFSDVLFMIEAIQKLKREPQTAKELYGLMGEGIDRNMPMPMEGVIDTGRIKRICYLNCNKPDDRKIPMSLEEEMAQMKHNGIGLWITPSYINHSCICNTHMVYFGDLVMVRANCNLKRGDEVTTNYQSFLKSYEERDTEEKWGFQCDCPLCDLERKESQELVKERKLLIVQYENQERLSMGLVEVNPRAALSRLLPVVNGIRQTYRNRKEWRTQLVGPLVFLSLVYHNASESGKALEACKEALDALGPQLMCNYIPVLYERMAENYILGMRNQKMAKNMALKAYQFAQHKFGPMDKKLFLCMYPEFEPFM